MLAPNEKTMGDVWAMGAQQGIPTPPLFQTWNAMLIEANRERHAADWLTECVGIEPYWPNFPKQYRNRGTLTRHRVCSVLPGLLFVPEDFLDNSRRDEIMTYVHSFGFVKVAGKPMVLHKAEIEIIRVIEAKLNLPDDSISDAVGKALQVGQRVRFLNEVYAAFFGDGAVIEVVSAPRIGVEVSQLFGCRQTVYTPASEIEVL